MQKSGNPKAASHPDQSGNVMNGACLVSSLPLFYPGNNMTNIYSSIIDEQNIACAYLESAERIELTGKSIRMKGIDGLNLRSIEPFAKKIVDRVRHELVSLTPCMPAVETEFPKDDGSSRKIFTYSLVDRIKARSIERQLTPYFEASYHPGLYSYRKGRSAQDAARNVVRRYKRNFGKDHIIRSDVTDYTDNINLDILRSRLRELDLKPDVFKLTNLFIGNSVVKGTSLYNPRRGLVQGVGLIAQFANVYLNSVDDELSRFAMMFRRVGDDFFLADHSADRIRKAWKLLQARTNELGLELGTDKSQVGSSAIDFDYLGYAFRDGQVLIKQSAIDRLMAYYKSRLRWTPMDLPKKIKRLERILRSSAGELHRKNVDFVFAYRFADSDEQLVELSKAFYRILTKFFFRQYSSAAQSRTRKLTHHLPLLSLTKIHHLLTHGKASYKSLVVPRAFQSAA